MNYERLVRKIRQNIFNYEGEKDIQAGRLLERAKQKMLSNRKNEQPKTGQYSGLTRKELAKTGTCEPDWY